MIPVALVVASNPGGVLIYVSSYDLVDKSCRQFFRPSVDYFDMSYIRTYLHDYSKYVKLKLRRLA